MNIIRSAAAAALTACALAAAAMPAALHAQQPDARKLDPLLRLAVAPPPPSAVPPAPGLAPIGRPDLASRLLTLRQDPAAGRTVRALLLGDVGDDALRRHGVVVTSRVGRVVSAWVPLDALAALSLRPDVEYIQASSDARRSGRAAALDRALPDSRALAVRKLTGLRGQGVIVGIVDTGIDWAHRDFRHPDGRTRIKFLWDMSDPAGPPPPELAASGGTLYTEAEINAALLTGAGVREVDVDGHGTHVAGIAAGSGLETNGAIPPGTFAGVAPEADLIVVKATRENVVDPSFGTADLADAFAFIHGRAQMLGRPYVTNVSIGGHNGPHDGSMLSEQVLDELVGPGMPGAAFTVSAGNDGDHDMHFSGTVAPGGEARRIVVGDYTPTPGALNDFLHINMWYTGDAAAVSITLVTPDGTRIGPVPAGVETTGWSAAGAVYIDNAVGGINPLNGDRYAEVVAYDFENAAGGVTRVAPGEWTILFGGSGGVLHGWVRGTVPARVHPADEDEGMLVTSPGNARNVTTVGSYTTKSAWTDANGSTHQVPAAIGAISAFSSPGPTRDGRLKPEIAAPGGVIASAGPLAGFEPFWYLQDRAHAMNAGTSMAAPHVAGALALLLQVHPNLDAIQLRDRLMRSARADWFVGATPNDRWGYGKLDVLETLRLGMLAGDANGDGRIDVGDAVSIVGYTLGRAQPTVGQALASELEVDGELDVADVVALMTRILGTQPALVAADDGAGAARAASASLGAQQPHGHVLSIPVVVGSPVPLGGLQLEIEYGGTGLRLGAPALAARAAGLSLDYADDGRTLRVIAYGAGGAAVEAGAGEVLYVPVLADGGAAERAAAAPRLARAVLVDRAGRKLPLGRGAAQLASGAAAIRIGHNRPNPMTAATGTRFELEIPGASGAPAGPAAVIGAQGVQGALVPDGGPATPVSVNIYNVRGQLVRRLFEGALPPGRFVFEWDARGESGKQLAPGLYFGRVAAGAAQETLRMILVDAAGAR